MKNNILYNSVLETIEFYRKGNLDINSINWRNTDSILNKKTKQVFVDRHKKFKKLKMTREQIYNLFIVGELFLFIFENQLIINFDAIRLFQADFLGWKPNQITWGKNDKK